MRQMRKRYVALKIDSTQTFDEKRLTNAIWDKVYQLFGEIGASQTALSKINYDKELEILVIRCSHKKLDETIAAIATIMEIDEVHVAFQVIAVSGTLKALRKKLSNRQT